MTEMMKFGEEREKTCSIVRRGQQNIRNRSFLIQSLHGFSLCFLKNEIFFG
jgi:hypothetical protein